MNWERIDAERQALQSLMELYEHAKRCQQLYERAHMAFPEPLQRLLCMSEAPAKSVAKQPSTSVHIPAPDRGDEPQEVGPDWVYIDLSSASATALALGLLRSSGKPVRPKDITNYVTGILPNVSSGTIANIGTRLDGELIQRSDDGWTLPDASMAGIIHRNRIWGPPAIFTKQELAAHRRMAILHVLKHFPTGLQTVQLVEQLQNCSWVHAPVNKDLLKADMMALESEHKVRRRGNSKKWELVAEGQE